MNFPKDELTFGLGLLGTVLGVVNLWRAIDRDRVRLRVTPKTAFFVEGHDRRDRLCIEVVNLSTFPVTICEVGLAWWFSNERLALIEPHLPDGKKWPRRLEPREAFTALFEPEVGNAFRMRLVRRAYARTECGEWRYGRSKALKAYSQRARKAE